MTLATDNASVLRGGRQVLDRIDLSLEPGTITAITGPNGAGKSSLVMTLAGLLPTAAGKVKLNGGSITALSPRDRAKAIGYLPQSGDLAWDVAVENLVALGRYPHRDRGHDAIEAAIADLDLQDLRHRPVSKLSGGERARALLARVLAGQPQWILADEPLAALDLSHQLSLLAHFNACAAKGQGVVIVLHDLATAMNHADRVVVLRTDESGGRVVADGPPETALSSQVIANTWGVDAQWLGEPGARALVTR